MRAGLAPPTLLAGVQASWAAAVGREIAEQAWPVAEKEAVVTVSCRSATWASELSLLSSQLLERLNRELAGRSSVRSLRFVVGPF
jgi:predicted nucleic acid-binding Zn ribbon protein